MIHAQRDKPDLWTLERDLLLGSAAMGKHNPKVVFLQPAGQGISGQRHMYLSTQ